jgi:plasmid stability protein
VGHPRKVIKMQSNVKARLPEGVRNYLSTRAKNNDRSMNADLINILKRVMKEEGQAESAIKIKQGAE